MTTTTGNRNSLCFSGPRPGGVVATNGGRARCRAGALAAGLVALLATSNCSQVADLDGLSKNYGNPDASPSGQDGPSDQTSDRIVSIPDATDGSTPDARDAPAEQVGESDGGDAGINVAVDARPDGGLDGDLPDGGGTDGGTSGDATPEGGGQICEAEAIDYATLELNTAMPSTTACGTVSANLPHFYAAVDSTTFGVAAACGACVRIQLSNAVVDAMILDLGSNRFAVDRVRLGVNQAAVDLLLPDGSTFVADGVPWNYIACPSATTGMVFTLQAGSSTTYSAMLIQNHRYRLETVEYKSGTTFKPLTRTMYNYWLAPLGMGAGPYTLRMTDINGAVVEQAGIPLMAGVPFQGQAQFPICPTP